MLGAFRGNNQRSESQESTVVMFSTHSRNLLHALHWNILQFLNIILVIGNIRLKTFQKQTKKKYLIASMAQLTWIDIVSYKEYSVRASSTTLMKM